MIAQDLHTHTTFCDGNNTPEEMVQAAIRKGMICIGFSGHSYTSIDDSYCMKKGATDYRAEIARLKEKYRGTIRILCGVEQDYYSEDTTKGYDYVIGSVHYLKLGDEFVPVDDTAEHLRAAADRHFDGDMYRVVETYYRTVADIVRKTGCDIIGHFDLITKFSERVELFDTSHPRYVAAWQAAVDELIKTGKPFEINTGAISRGYRTSPYPDEPILRYLREKNAKVLLSGDSHSTDALCCQFDKWEPVIRDLGFSM